MGAWFGIGFLTFALVIIIGLTIYERGIDKAHKAKRAEFESGRKKLEEQLTRLNWEDEE